MLEEFTLSIPDGRTRPAVVARPETDGPCPGVVVIHDLIGMTPDTHRHCRRFAEAGYVAVAPDLFDGGRLGCVVRTVVDMFGRPGKTMPVLEAARAWLADQRQVDGERLGVIGFCMGGGFALLAAADHRYAVAAPFYGVVPRKVERLEGICPTLAQYGGRDLMFRGYAPRLSRHLTQLGVEHEVLVHEEVGHSFMNEHHSAMFGLGKYTPMRAQHDPPTEALAWQRVLEFFDEHMPRRDREA